MRFLRRVLPIIALVIVAFGIFGGNHSSRAAEPPPLDLQVGGEGDVPWIIGNVKPGDTGTKVVTLHNAGTDAGFVTIWVSDILDLDSANATDNTSLLGQLSQYLQLELITPRLGTSLAMPATIQQWPHSYNSPTTVTISSLPAGDTQEIMWKWRLPPETGNEVQGDSVIVTINYMLEEMPFRSPIIPILPQPSPSSSPTPAPSSPSPPTASLSIGDGEKAEQLEISKDGTMVRSFSMAALEGRVVLAINKGTSIITTDGKVPGKIEIAAVSDAPPLPDGMVMVSPLYDITAYVDNVAKKVNFSQPITLILSYLAGTVPEEAQALLVIYYDEELENWTELEPVSGLVAEEGEVAAKVSHFTKFAIVALVPRQLPPEVIAPAPPAPIAARFQLSNLNISPNQINSGDSVTISVEVTNAGGISAERTITVKMNGLFVDARVVRLAPGETRRVSVAVTPYKPGVYQIVVGELEDSLTVNSGTTMFEEAESGRRWPLMVTIPVILGVAIAAALLLLLRKRKSGKNIFS